MRNFFILILLFLMHEGLYLIPDKYRVAPGIFRMSDAFFIIIVAVFLFFLPKIIMMVREYKEESSLVIFYCLLVAISPLMAKLFFGQSYIRGLILIRQDLFWLSFFLYFFLIRDTGDIGKFIKFFTPIVAIYVLIFIVLYYYPRLGIAYYPSRFYDPHGPMIRLGEFRMFFPYKNIAILFYCFAVAQLLTPNSGSRFMGKMLQLGFVCLVWLAVILSYTRVVIISLMVTTVFALFFNNRRNYGLIGLVFLLLIGSLQYMTNAVSDESSVLEQSRLGKLAFQSDQIKKETGRMSQMRMYMRQFKRSPITGVGNLATQRDDKHDFLGTGASATYKKYGFFNGTDWGYLKILGENGLLGILWVLWFFSYFYRKTRQALDRTQELGDQVNAAVISRGLQYFIIYVLISSITLPHFVYSTGITIIPLSLTLMAITRKTLNV